MQFLSQLFGKETVIGVDIGSSSIKVVHAEPIGGDRWKIHQSLSCAIPADTVKDGIVTGCDAVASALRNLLNINGLSHATGAVAAVAGGSVIVRHVQLPKMTEATLRKSVRYEAAKYITASVDDCCVEFEIVGPTVGDPDKMDVMLVAAPHEMINSRTVTLELAGLEPCAIDFEAFAVQRALLDLSPTKPGEGETIALLHLGASASELTIIADGYFALTRSIPIAGEQFTMALKSSYKWDHDEAESRKFAIDLSLLLRPDADPATAAEAKSMQPVVDEILREVRRSTNYFKSQLIEGSLMLPSGAGGDEDGDNSTRLAQVSKLVITGGSSLLQGLEPYMSARLGMPVETWNVFENPRLDTSSLPIDVVSDRSGFFTLAVGLALKEAAPFARSIAA